MLDVEATIAAAAAAAGKACAIGDSLVAPGVYFML